MKKVYENVLHKTELNCLLSVATLFLCDLLFKKETQNKKN